MADIGYGYTQIQAMNLFRFLAAKYKGNNFQGFKASYCFMTGLYSKFPELTVRKIASYEFNRAKFLNQNSVQKFFDILKTAYGMTEELSGKPINPRDIWSLDEVGFKLNDNKNMFIIIRKGTKHSYTIKPDDTSHLTANAKGYILEPCFILANDRSVTNFRNACIEAGFTNPLVLGTKSSFINFESFDSYIDYFVDEAKFSQEDYSILVMDGHKAHAYNIKAL